MAHLALIVAIRVGNSRVDCNRHETKNVIKFLRRQIVVPTHLVMTNKTDRNVGSSIGKASKTFKNDVQAVIKVCDVIKCLRLALKDSSPTLTLRLRTDATGEKKGLEEAEGGSLSLCDRVMEFA